MNDVRRLSPDLKFTLVLAGVMIALWAIHLWPEWSRNPDLSHGFLAPILFAVLLHEARTHSSPRFLSENGPAKIAIVIFGFGAVALLVLAGLYASALDWSHSLVDFLLAGALCSLLVAVWIQSSLGSIRLISFSWAAAAAILLWALSAPIPPGTYTQMTQALQTSVAQGVIATLHFLGITAVRNGNVIELPHVSVGVEEACSGIRSLISCVFVSVFISAVMVRGTARRVFILLLAPFVAIAMNFVRSVSLTLMAEAGIDITGAWHDVTGFAVLGITALILAGAAWVLARFGGGEQPTPEESRRRTNDAPGATGWFRSVNLATVLACSLLLASFAFLTRSAPRVSSEPPALSTLLPDQVSGWTVHTRQDLYQFTSQLQTDVLFERTYERMDEKGEPVQVTVYLAYWPPGQASVSLVASHTPDACWPGSGWVEKASAERRVTLSTSATRLPPAEFRSFEFQGFPQHVWYWHLYAGRPVIHDGLGSPLKLLSLAWHYGFRKDGDQVFIRFSSNRNWEEIAQEPLIEELSRRLSPLGLVAEVRPVVKRF